MRIKSAIGDQVRRQRADKEWTQEKLAYETGVSNRYLQKVEASERLPSIITIFKLARAFGIGPDRIIMPIWRDWLKGKFLD